MNSRVLVLFLIPVCSWSCNRKTNSREWLDRTIAVQAVYSTGTIAQTRQSLLDYVEALKGEDPQKVKMVFYDMCLAGAYGRLYLIDEKVGNKQSAQLNYSNSVYWLNQREAREGLPIKHFTPAGISNWITMDDSTSNTRWKQK
jgi:hypothetical protein